MNTYARGFAEVVGIEKSEIIEAMNRTLEQPKKLPEKSPYGNGKAAERIVNLIEQNC